MNTDNLTLTIERIGGDYALLDGSTEVCLVRPVPGEFPFDTASRAQSLAELIVEGWNTRYQEDDGK